jgi:malate synthase
MQPSAVGRFEDAAMIEVTSRVRVSECLYRFVNDEAMPGTGVQPDAFWGGLAALICDLEPVNRELLAVRARLQSELDRWHRQRRGEFDLGDYKKHLHEIGYLGDEVGDFHVATENVDPELAAIAGPQLVVPLDNARYALNAANARWGSLYDALYGTDAIPREAGTELSKGYDPARGAQVVTFVQEFLDRHFPLCESMHRSVVRYAVDGDGMLATLSGGNVTRLEQPGALIGYRGAPLAPSVLLMVHHGLHVELHIDREHTIGRDHPAGLCDVVLESAVTTIQDCEDSVAAVDAEDKVRVYRNWLGLMRGTLESAFLKHGKPVMRRLNADRRYKALDGSGFSLPGRSLMLVRNVGHFIMSDAVTLDERPVPETFLDAAVTALIAIHDLRRTGPFRNSRTGSVYIVKPKMHGSDEVAFADRLFAQVEDLLGLPRFTLKMGIMDEERRTSVNLKACIHAARRRVVFINTGFLDRTGDEIRSVTEAGPVIRKADMKAARWLDAYERRNVDLGLACGIQGRGQIGKGMWAMPELMLEMLRVKVGHPLSGASTAWVPSPTAATLHALHYHQVNVPEVQANLKTRVPASRDEILLPPLQQGRPWSAKDIQDELNNNLQSILGYVVRWVDLGVGCSKVPDYHDVALMEDRATLRISAQHVANWLHHGICTTEQVESGLREMARKVDAQNSADESYHPMADDFARNVAFLAARDLVLSGLQQPNGYTEAILNSRRRERKQQLS